jgi:hypothetical protein
MTKWNMLSDAELSDALKPDRPVFLELLDMRAVDNEAARVLDDGESEDSLPDKIKTVVSALHSIATIDGGEWSCCVCAEDYSGPDDLAAVALVGHRPGDSVGLICTFCWERHPDDLAREIRAELGLLQQQ